MKIIILLVIILLSSCRSPAPIMQYKERTITRDTTIYIKLPSDTIVISDTVYIDNNNLVQMEPIYAFNEFSKASAYVKDSRLYLELNAMKDSIKVDAKLNDKEVFNTRIDKELVIPLWIKITIISLIIICILLLIKK
jgi:hypothetical protein